MKTILSTLIACASTILVAADQATLHQDELIRPGTGLKSVAIVNTQSRLAQREIDEVARMIDEATCVNVRSFRADGGEPSAILNASGSELVVIVKDDTLSSAMLIAPEDRWAVVNVGKLLDDLPSEKAKAKFFVPRARKEILRCFSLLCGGGSSQFPGNVMNSATIRGLDLIKEQIPADMIDNYTRYLTQLGVKPKEYVPYEFACQEGWAPQPTNDMQKAAWTRVHNPPEKPIKITYDKDKQKPVVK